MIIYINYLLSLITSLVNPFSQWSACICIIHIIIQLPYLIINQSNILYHCMAIRNFTEIRITIFNYPTYTQYILKSNYYQQSSFLIQVDLMFLIKNESERRRKRMSELSESDKLVLPL